MLRVVFSPISASLNVIENKLSGIFGTWLGQRYVFWMSARLPSAKSRVREHLRRSHLGEFTTEGFPCKILGSFFGSCGRSRNGLAAFPLASIVSLLCL